MYCIDSILMLLVNVLRTINFSYTLKWCFFTLRTKKQQLKDKQDTLLQKNIKGIISDTLLKEQLLGLDEEIWAIDKRLSQKEEKKVDVKSILDYINEFLISPSFTWRNMSFRSKINLQWFVFPEGVQFDGTEFRTTKISSLFKLKQFFLPEVSFNVHYPRLYYEHTKLANNPALQNLDSVVWEDIRNELLRLDEIIHSTEEKDDPGEDQMYPLSPP